MYLSAIQTWRSVPLNCPWCTKDSLSRHQVCGVQKKKQKSQKSERKKPSILLRYWHGNKTTHLGHCTPCWLHAAKPKQRVETGCIWFDSCPSHLLEKLEDETSPWKAHETTRVFTRYEKRSDEKSGCLKIAWWTFNKKHDMIYSSCKIFLASLRLINKWRWNWSRPPE